MAGTKSYAYEYWQMGIPEPENDDNGLLIDLNIAWDSVAQYEIDDDLYDDYAGAFEETEDVLSEIIEEEVIDETVVFSYSNQFDSDAVDDGVVPFRVVQTNTLGATNAGFSVAWEVRNTVNRPWFNNEVQVTDNKRDYQTHYGQEDNGYSLTLLKNKFDRRASEDYSFTDAFNTLVDGYVANIYNILGDLRETNITYKQSPTQAISIKNTSTFKLDAATATGTTVTTSTRVTSTTTSTSTGGY